MKEFCPEYGEDSYKAEARYEAEWKDECIRRVPELASVEDDEFRRWQDFLEELDTLTADEMADVLEQCAYYLDEPGLGWIESEHGGAVFRPYR